MTASHAHIGFGPANLAADHVNPRDLMTGVGTIGANTLIEVIPEPPDIAYAWMCQLDVADCAFLRQGGLA